MNYEEKYTEALERAREFMTNKGVAPNADAFKTAKELIETIFPELRESEDERIRKSILELVKQSSVILSPMNQKSMISWLEKQKESNILINTTSEIEYADKYSHDVWEKLMSKFKAIEGYSIGCNDVSDIVLYAILNAFEWKRKQKPAEWSEEDEYQLNTILHGLDLKRELYKKEGNKVEEKRYKTQYDWLKSIKDRVQPQPKLEWNKEDETGWTNTLIMIKEFASHHYTKDSIKPVIDWLESIKDRIQPKQ